MAIIALMGPPGSGKTTMAVTTAIKQPVHAIDIDRKIRATAGFRESVAAGKLTFKEIGDTIHEDNLARRLRAMVDNKQGEKPPRGWANFAGYCESADRDPNFKNAGTIVVDSYTQLGMHLRSHIQFEMKRSKFQWDDWSTWKAMWQETTTILIDYCLNTAIDGCLLKSGQLECEHGKPEKDLIVCIHERVSEKPGKDTTEVRVTSTAGGGGKSRDYVGKMDVLICGSIEGAFGLEFGTYFSDVYALRVDVVNGKPEWICRVHPDGQRDLRCSFPRAKESEYDPNFKHIMNGAARK
jgi:hypothetical protein